MQNHFTKLKKQEFKKLIIGAALKEFNAIEIFSYLFTHAQADAIDISAFPHSVISALKGINTALAENSQLTKPLLMVSINVGQDPHFRRIELNKELCTSCEDCIVTCPSLAFFLDEQKKFQYNQDLCFGCANCLPACQDKALSFSNWNSFDSKSLTELIELGANAIEIHLNADFANFTKIYQQIPKTFLLESFCIGSQSANADFLASSVDEIIKNVSNKHSSSYQFIIQVDGLAMSGAKDLKIKDKDQVSLDKAKLVIDYIQNKYPQQVKNIFVQVAGGTDSKTFAKAKSQKLNINGVAIGSYARKKINQSQTKQEALKIAAEIFT